MFHEDLVGCFESESFSGSVLEAERNEGTLTCAFRSIDFEGVTAWRRPCESCNDRCLAVRVTLITKQVVKPNKEP